MISSRPGTGMEMLCCANVFGPMHERAKAGNQARYSHGLSIICLLKDHHASTDSLWMLKWCPSLEYFGRVWGFAWFTFYESEHKSAGSTKKGLAGIDFQNLLFLLFSTLSIPTWAEGCCRRLALPGCMQLAPRFCRPRRCELGNHQEWADHLKLWPLVPLKVSCPGSGTATQTWGTRRNFQLARTSWCPIRNSSTHFLRKNSTALRFYQNPPHTSAMPVTQTIIPNTWLRSQIQDPTPKPVGPYCFAAAVEFANYFWATGGGREKEWKPSYKIRFIWTKVKTFKF